MLGGLGAQCFPPDDRFLTKQELELGEESSVLLFGEKAVSVALERLCLANNVQQLVLHGKVGSVRAQREGQGRSLLAIDTKTSHGTSQVRQDRARVHEQTEEDLSPQAMLLAREAGIFEKLWVVGDELDLGHDGIELLSLFVIAGNIGAL